MARVLIIDDVDLVLEALERIFRKAGHEVVTASNGIEGLALLEPGGIDLAVVDIIMPDKEGIETIIDIRRDHPGVKIIAMSGAGNGHMDFLGVARKLGADASFPKPFDETAFIETVERLIG